MEEAIKKIFVSAEWAVRDFSEVKPVIVEELAKESPDFILVSCLLWAGFQSREPIIRFINHLLKKNNNGMDDYVLCLFWLLKLENDPKEWHSFQEQYHSMHSGAREPDFRLPIILEWVGGGKKVLDVGVHNGIHTNEIAKKNDVLGIDLPQVIQRFSDQYDFGYQAWDVVKDGIPHPDGIFHVVIAGEFLEHLLEPVSFLKEARRVLCNKGIIIVSCPYRDLGWHDPLHCQLVDEQKIKEWFDGLFTIREVKMMPEKKCIMVLGVKE